MVTVLLRVQRVDVLGDRDDLPKRATVEEKRYRHITNIFDGLHLWLIHTHAPSGTPSPENGYSSPLQCSVNLLDSTTVAIVKSRGFTPGPGDRLITRIRLCVCEQSSILRTVLNLLCTCDRLPVILTTK